MAFVWPEDNVDDFPHVCMCVCTPPSAEAVWCRTRSVVRSAATAPVHGVGSRGEDPVQGRRTQRSRELRGRCRRLQDASVSRYGSGHLRPGASDAVVTPKHDHGCKTSPRPTCRTHHSVRMFQFEITDDVEAVQMLQRSTQVGEFYVMGPPTIPFGKKDNFQNFMVTPPCSHRHTRAHVAPRNPWRIAHDDTSRIDGSLRRAQDIVIFDEEADRHVVIPWEDAVEATFAHFTNASTAVGPASDKLVQTGGALATAGTKSAAWIAATAYRQTRTWDRPAGGYAIAPFEAGMNSLAGAVATSTAGLTVADWRALANCWHYINRNGTEGVTVTTINGAGDAYIETPGCFPTTQFELNGDLNDPFHIPFEFRGGSIQDFMQISEFRINLVVARPFIEHVMHSAVMTVSGRDTGAMLFGPSDMQISANTQVKTIEG